MLKGLVMEALALPGVWSLSPIAALIGLLVLQSWAVTSGRFIPKSSHERELAAANLRADDKQTTIDIQNATIAALRHQNSELLEVGKTVQALLVSAGPAGFQDGKIPTGGA